MLLVNLCVCHGSLLLLLFFFGGIFWYLYVYDMYSMHAENS